MRVLTLLLLLLHGQLLAQKFDGFIITRDDSLFKGYMRISLTEHGRKFEITPDKRAKPRAFFLEDMKYYAYKRDTFAVLDNFYPFKDEQYTAHHVDAKILIGRGRLKLFHGTLSDYEGDLVIVVAPSIPAAGAYKQKGYTTYFIKDGDGVIYGIRKDNQKRFRESIEPIIADNEVLLRKVNAGQLRFRDIKKIVAEYNAAFR